MRFNEEIQVEKIETCFICGASGVPFYQEMRDRLFGVSGVWSFLRCPHDGLVWLSPRPCNEDTAKIYTTYYTHIANNVRRSVLVSLKDKIESTLLKTKFGYNNLSSGRGSRLVRWIIESLPMTKEIAGSKVMWLNAHPKGKLLDVGCGSGIFLAVMQKLGWDVSGVEPDIKAAMIARKRLGVVPITTGKLEDANFSDNLFDAVTAHHVAEHMHDPAGFFRESFRILKPGGKLAVTTPNILSLGQQVFRKSWRGLEPPRHIYLFSAKTLWACAEKVGYQLEILRTTARSAWEIWCTSRLIHRDGSIPGGFPRHLTIVLRIEGLVFQLLEHILLRFKWNIGEGIVLIASKPIG